MNAQIKFLASVLTMILTVLLGFTSYGRAAITWEKTYGNGGDDVAYSIQQTTDGGYVVIGLTFSFGAGEDDIYVIKLDELGNTLWGNTYGGFSYESGNSIQQISDGYVVGGWTYSFGIGTPGNANAYIIKLDTNGNKIWEKTHGGNLGEYVFSIQQTTDGGFIAAGGTLSMGAGDQDFYVLKLDANGDKLWEKAYGGINEDFARSIQQTNDGGYIVAGETNSFGAGSTDFYVIKLDQNGNKVWEKTFGGSNRDVAFSIQQTGEGGYIVTGGTLSFGAGSTDSYVIKLDATGNKIWEKTFGGISEDGTNSIQQTTDGGYIVAGPTYSFGAGSYDAYIIKLDASGNKIWEKTHGRSGAERSNFIQQTSDGGYIVAGSSTSFGAGDEDFYVLKLDEDGDLNPDTVPPASITNLQATSPTQHTMLLTWTATGDDGNTGTASLYDIRYSTQPLTDQTWENATQVTGEPSPKSSGSSENFEISGLNPDTVYYFAIKAADEVPNWSALSNVAAAKTLSSQDVLTEQSIEINNLKEDIQIADIQNANSYVSKADAAVSKIQEALQYISQGENNIAFNSLNASQNELNALLNSISAQSGKKIEESLAGDWASTITAIIQALEDIKTELQTKAKAQVAFPSSVPEKITLSDVFIYPNPYRGGNAFSASGQQGIKFKYKASGNVQNVVIEIYTIKGKLVDRIENLSGNGEANYNFADKLPNGVYIYRITLSDGTNKVSKTGKIVVVK